MLELVLILLVTVLGAFVFLSLTKLSPVSSTSESSGAPATRAPKKKPEEKKKKESKAPVVEEVEVRKGRGRTVPGLNMEADPVRLVTTEDKAEIAEKRRKAQEKARKAELAEKAAAAKAAAEEEGIVEEKRRKDKKKKEEPKVDVSLELQRQRQAMSSRINNFIKSQSNTKQRGKESIGSVNPATMKVSKDIRSNSAPWKSE